MSLLRVTLFTRANCSLCHTASVTLTNIHKRRPFRFDKVDIMAAGSEKWKIYEFDVPVIHIEKLQDGSESKLDAMKLMHRFKEEEVDKVMDEVENGS